MDVTVSDTGSGPEETLVPGTPAQGGTVAASPGADDQVASTDEYEIALAEGVDDETLCDDTAETTRFSITSYGADYTVDSLVKRMRIEAFTIPTFQRRFVWSQRHASKFIESLLMGLPVPGIFLYREGTTNKHLVIDGQQRLRTLQAYYDGLFGERKFRLIGVIDEWANKTYAELSPSDQLKLDDSIVHATIFSQDEPENALDSVYFVFERINTGGIRLTAQEIRKGVSGFPCVGGHNGEKGGPICPDAKSLRSRTSFSTSCWRAVPPARHLIRAACSIR